MRKEIEKLNLNPDNAVVIGSGILQALGIRESNDIDLVVKKREFERLKKLNYFKIKFDHNREILASKRFEIGINWYVLGKNYYFSDFSNDSIIIDDVRYISLDFLYKAKKSWVKNKTSRPKDIADIKLIKNYKLQRQERRA
jgi:hypothetical protein